MSRIEKLASDIEQGKFKMSKQEIINRYGNSTVRLTAKRMGLSTSLIYDLLHLWNVPVRKPGWLGRDESPFVEESTKIFNEKDLDFEEEIKTAIYK